VSYLDFFVVSQAQVIAVVVVATRFHETENS